MPLISVIIPTYNREKFVIEAINSILCQSMEDMEILVIDDGSTDNTRFLLDTYLIDARIRYYWKKNEGVSAARNFGIDKAKGTYIAFLDSDDILINNSLQQQVSVLQSNPEIGLVQGDFEKITETGKQSGRHDTSWYKGLIYPDILCHWNNLIAIDTVMIPRHVFKETGKFNIQMKIGEDLDLWNRIARKYEFAHIPEPLAQVRVHSSNASGNRLFEADAFSCVLNQAFTTDCSLSSDFQSYALGQMYSITGLNLLSDYDRNNMPEARRRFKYAIRYRRNTWKAYGGWLLTFLPLSIRHQLGKIWRKKNYPLNQ